MKRAFAMALAALLLLSACAPRAETAGGSYEVYYAAVLDGADGRDAITAQSVSIADADALSTRELAAALLERLLDGPQESGAVSPFPAGTRLLSLLISGRRATVDLSEQYAQLSGIDLSVADYCVTLTLTQLEGINTVTVLAAGRSLPYRRTQLLTAADPLLGSRDLGLRPIGVSLYFLDLAAGGLRAQRQTLVLYEGQTRVNAVLDALLLGPEADDTLAPLLPQDFSILSYRIDDGVCVVNLPPDALRGKEETMRRLGLESFGRSLLSLSGIDSVQLLIEGEPAAVYPAADEAQ